MGLEIAAREPAVVDDAVFKIERSLDVAGEVAVRPGDLVNPETVVASASTPVGRVITMHLSRELGVAADTLSRYLTKPVGSNFEAGEPVARARRGLRVIVANAPVSGTLTEIDAANGTGVLVPGTAALELAAVIGGQVESIVDGQGAVIRARGSRVLGILGLGRDTSGPFKIAIDRADRELTPDSITADLRGAVVLGGMTVGAAAMRRLADVGARGVVVGSLSEAEIRRAIHPTDEPMPADFWRAGHESRPFALELERAPLTVFVTEGLGRRPMAGPIFQFLAKREGQTASLLLHSRPREGSREHRLPELYFTKATIGDEPDGEIPTIKPENGVVARLVDPAHLGTVVTCRSEAMIDHSLGYPCPVVEVELSNGRRQVVPAVNLELLTAK